MAEPVLKINSPEKFAREIDELVTKYKIEYIDAVIMYCERKGIELETAASLIKSNSNMKSKIQSEAETLNFLPKTNKLPI